MIVSLRKKNLLNFQSEFSKKQNVIKRTFHIFVVTITFLRIPPPIQLRASYKFRSCPVSSFFFNIHAQYFFLAGASRVPRRFVYSVPSKKNT